MCLLGSHEPGPIRTGPSTLEQSLEAEPVTPLMRHSLCWVMRVGYVARDPPLNSRPSHSDTMDRFVQGQCPLLRTVRLWHRGLIEIQREAVL